VPLKVLGGTFVVPIEINGAITLDFVVDSGAADVAVTADVAATLMRAKTLGQTDFIGRQTYILADGSELPSDIFIIRSLKIGDHRIEKVRGSVVPPLAPFYLGSRFFVILGRGLSTI
jgi:predicted aspartyl protease